jgi:hypothetical protein
MKLGCWSADMALSIRFVVKILGTVTVTLRDNDGTLRSVTKQILPYMLYSTSPLKGFNSPVNTVIPDTCKVFLELTQTRQATYEKMPASMFTYLFPIT